MTGTSYALILLLQGFPQGAVLGPLLFVSNITQLSSIISDSSVNHHLYANDTQLCISFPTSDFSQNVSHLEASIDFATTWMSAKHFPINQSETESCLDFV